MIRTGAWNEYNETGQNRFWALHPFKELIDELRARSRASNDRLAEVISNHLREINKRIYQCSIDFYEKHSGIKVEDKASLEQAKETMRSKAGEKWSLPTEEFWPKLPGYALPKSSCLSKSVVSKYLDYHFPKKK
jgi:hypothetical protein